MQFAFPSASSAARSYTDVKGGTWYGGVLSSFGICFNRDVCRLIGVIQPRTWSDLADPRYANWLVFADPTAAPRRISRI